MAEKRLIVVLFIVLTLALISQAITAPVVQATVTPGVAWFCVQNRTFEDGTQVNRLGFSVNDTTSGAYLLKNKLESMTLYDPKGKPVAVPTPVFSGVYTEIDGQYDDKNGLWNYGMPFAAADYKADFAEDLMVGWYHLVAIFDGITVEGSYYFAGSVELPIIPASSIKTAMDSNGNLICSWAVSYDLSNNNPSLATFARADITVKKKGKTIGSLCYRVPTHLGRLFVPKAMVDVLKGLGGTSYSIKILLRTNDNSNRSYSDNRKFVLQ